MKLIRYLADFAAIGQVGDAGLGSAPGDFVGELGKSYVDDRRKGRMRRDFGLFELTFLRATEKWRCTAIAVQVHRLRYETVNNILPYTVEDDRPVPSVILWSDLCAAILDLGVDVSQVGFGSDYLRYYNPASEVIATVVAELAAEKDAPAGMIWALHRSVDTPVWLSSYTREK